MRDYKDDELSAAKGVIVGLIISVIVIAVIYVLTV